MAILKGFPSSNWLFGPPPPELIQKMREYRVKFEPGKYIWRAKSDDKIVVVTEYLGKGSDGRDYVRIEGSATGIPLDELTKERSVQSSRKPRPKRLF